MYKLDYLPIAKRDMTDIAKYIGVKLQNPDAADRLTEKMIIKAEELKDMPYKYSSYTPIRKLKHEYRKLIVDNYIMFYWVNEDTKIITISRVIYAKRDYDHFLE